MMQAWDNYLDGLREVRTVENPPAGRRVNLEVDGGHVIALDGFTISFQLTAPPVPGLSMLRYRYNVTAATQSGH
jgi:hypothetical protein